MQQTQLKITTRAREIIEITDQIQRLVNESHYQTGLCHLFLKHTSASLILCENADSAVRQDLATFFSRLVPEGERIYSHHAEGPDDMPAHIRTILTTSTLTIPIHAAALALGTWQGIFLYEHRNHTMQRQLWVTLQGD